MVVVVGVVMHQIFSRLLRMVHAAVCARVCSWLHHRFDSDKREEAVEQFAFEIVIFPVKIFVAIPIQETVLRYFSRTEKKKREERTVTLPGNAAEHSELFRSDSLDKKPLFFRDGVNRKVLDADKDHNRVDRWQVGDEMREDVRDTAR